MRWEFGHSTILRRRSRLTEAAAPVTMASYHRVVQITAIGTTRVPSLPQPVPVAFVITDLDPGGAERALVQIATRLDRARWSPAVVCLSESGALVSELERAEIPVVCLGARRIRQLPTLLWRLTRVLKRLHPAIVQTFLYHANITGRIAARLAGVPHVVSGIRVAEKRSRLRLAIDRWTDMLVDRHVCVSQDVARFSIDVGGLPANKVVVIHNGVDAERFANAVPADLTQFGIPPKNRTVLFVGRLDPQKYPGQLLACTDLLAKNFDDVHFLFVGDGPLRSSLESRVQETGQSNRVHFAGWRSDVAEIMRAAYCFVLPSLWEGQPNVVLEAMAAGLPVISTDVEGIRELVHDGDTGIIAPSSSVPALLDSIRALLNAPDRARSLAEKAQDKVRKEFTWDRAASAYDSLYASLLPN